MLCTYGSMNFASASRYNVLSSLKKRFVLQSPARAFKNLELFDFSNKSYLMITEYIELMLFQIIDMKKSKFYYMILCTF
ncbi:hypothetical protein DERP_011336 [Dermatophagoides pteronyssinus]|uniref:Uncharacterized protein n=1 Tax=Dermatophagoides pteronyssinus TaxID=6956 RepID=A0ABQ8J7A6_DERPT|nr:hypothetical protein DERP_011336 [Dermatophagoides pteronyssinus]